MITQHTINKGTMQNCMYMARKQSPVTETIANADSDPVYDFYLEDGRTGWCRGQNSLREMAAFGQAMVVQQRPGTGTLEKFKS